MSPKYIYTYLQENRQNILSFIKNSSIENLESCHDIHEDSVQSNSDSQSEKQCKIIKFNITLFPKEWKKIMPNSTTYYDTVHSNRRYIVLEPRK